MTDRLRNKKTDKFWIDLKTRTAEGEFKNAGEVLVSFELMPLDVSQACKVGSGRSEPNVDPFLPEPTGRFK